MIDKLLEDMFTYCRACQGIGQQEVDVDSYEDCSACNGDGYDLSYEGYLLQQAILKGKKP